jgi:hypothetical protein
LITNQQKQTPLEWAMANFSSADLSHLKRLDRAVIIAEATEINLYMITEGDGANVGRLWRVTSIGLTLVGEIRLADGTEVSEDLEGFDVPYLPLACGQ